MLEPRAKVLIADDDADLRKMLSILLPKSRYEVFTASDGNGAWQTIRELVPDIVLLDVMMPGMDGLEICRLIRGDNHTNNIPVILLTAKTQLKDKLDGIEAGADDYVTKPIDPLELQARIEMHLRRHKRETDMSPITSLPGNRAIDRALDRTLGSGRPFAFMYIDLDNFKAYNDRYGISRGSEVIKMTGSLVSSAVAARGNRDDFTGHVGGDDFVAITSPDKAEGIASEIIRTFDEKIPECYNVEDLENGYITAVDRKGVETRFPVMTISIAIAHNMYREIDNAVEVGQIAAEIKKYAKDLDGSVYVFDRRRRAGSK